MSMLGERIKAALEARGKTASWLAANAGLSKGFLSEIVNGKTNVSVNKVVRIAQVLGVSVDFLATGNTKPYICPFCEGSGYL